MKSLVDTAILIGTTPDGKCVYSAMLSLDEYWDGEHPWDSDGVVVSLGLILLRGFLFGSEGQLLQHFESHFSPVTGMHTSGWAIHEDGTRTES